MLFCEMQRKKQPVKTQVYQRQKAEQEWCHHRVHFVKVKN